MRRCHSGDGSPRNAQTAHICQLRLVQRISSLSSPSPNLPLHQVSTKLFLWCQAPDVRLDLPVTHHAKRETGRAVLFFWCKWTGLRKWECSVRGREKLFTYHFEGRYSPPIDFYKQRLSTISYNSIGFQCGLGPQGRSLASVLPTHTIHTFTQRYSSLSLFHKNKFSNTTTKHCRWALTWPR